MRGQFRGYLQEKGVAPDSKVETFAALQLVSRFLALEGRALLHPRRQEFAGDLHRGSGARSASLPPSSAIMPSLQNYLRFRISPEMTIALGATVMAQEERT